MEISLNIEQTIVVAVIAFILGILATCVFSKFRKSKNENGNRKKIDKLPIEHLVMALSLIFLIASITLSAFNVITELATACMTFFSSVIFSWLLTKENSKAELKEHEQELALKSYRHINYLETAALTAGKTIQQYTNDENSTLDSDVKLVLSHAMDQIGYIQGGINTCKMDWVDMLSESDKAKCTQSESTEDFGTTVVDANIHFNQEDA